MRGSGTVAVVAAMLALAAAPASAATIQPICSSAALIDAITLANSNGVPDDIVLPVNCTYTFTVSNNNTSGPNALPAIGSDITIEGNGSTIERSAPAEVPFRLLYVGADPADPDTLNFPTPGAGDLTLRNLTLAGGLASGGAFPGAGGGAIMSQGEVTLERVTIRSSQAQGGDNALGGAVFNSHGELFLRNATISGNTAQGAINGLGAGIFNLNGDIDADSSTIAFNTGSGQGQALFNYGYDGTTAHDTSAIFRNSILSDGIGGGADLSADAPEEASGGADNLSTSTVDVSHFNIVESQLEGGEATIIGPPITTNPSLQPLLANLPSPPVVPPLPYNPPLTHAITSTSSAYNSGQTDLATDERQVLRPQGGADDIGAFELQVVDDPLVPRTLTLKYSARGERFKGKIQSGVTACVETITVTVFRKLKGDDKLIARVQTNDDGKYKLLGKSRKGKYYSSVEVDLVPGVAECIAAESDVVKVG